MFKDVDGLIQQGTAVVKKYTTKESAGLAQKLKSEQDYQAMLALAASVQFTIESGMDAEGTAGIATLMAISYAIGYKRGKRDMLLSNVQVAPEEGEQHV